MRHVLEESVMRLGCNLDWSGAAVLSRYPVEGALDSRSSSRIRQRQLESELGHVAIDGVLDRTAKQFSEINGKICFCSQKGPRKRVF